MLKVLIFTLGLVTLTLLVAPIKAQRDEPIEGAGDVGQQPRPRFSDMFRNLMSINVPAAFNMVRSSSGLGIDVLSGLVKVEKGEEATRSGLMGSRPLSVRVFGVPVYERGTRVRNPVDDQPQGPTRQPDSSRGPEPDPSDSAEELPVIPA